MGLSSTLCCLLATLTLVSGNLLTDDRRTIRPSRGEPEKGAKASKTQGRQDRLVNGPTLKVFDFSADNDGQPDSNGEYTSATLDAGSLPESFTVCSAIMTDAWTMDFTSAGMFQLLHWDGDKWGAKV